MMLYEDYEFNPFTRRISTPVPYKRESNLENLNERQIA